MRHRFRPHRSVSLLHGIIRIAMISRNSVIAVCTPCTSVFRSLLMSVIITFMFEPAKLQMNWASASGRINLRGEISARPGARAPLIATGFPVTRSHHRNESGAYGDDGSVQRTPHRPEGVKRAQSSCLCLHPFLRLA